jgi:hypothetical protein
MLLTLPFEHADSQSAEWILKKNAEAVEGNISKIKSIILESDIETEGLRGTFKQMALLPKCYKEERDMGIYTEIKLYDGETAWVLWNNALRRQGKWEKPYFLTSSYLFCSLYLVKPDLNPTYLGENERFYIIEIHPKDGEAAKLFLDKHTYLLNRVERKNIDDMSTLITTYSDFHTVEGIKIPFKIEETNRDTTLIQVKSIDFNKPIEVTDFEPPKLEEKYNFPKDRYSKVPFQLHNNNILVEASINNSGPFNFLLDSGTSGNVIDVSVADKLGLTAEGQATATSVGENARKVSYAKVKDLTIGGIELYKPMFVMMPIKIGFKSMRVETDIDGILGYPFLSNFVVEINYIDKYIRLYEPEKFNYRGKNKRLPITWDNDVPLIEAVINGNEKGYFFLDMGCMGSLFLDKQFAKDNKLIEKSKKKIEGKAGSLTGTSNMIITRVDSIRIGNYEIDYPITNIIDLGAHFIGIIGGGILKQFDLILDYPHESVIFEPNENFGKHDKYDGSGLTMLRENGKLIVKGVHKDSPVEKAGIKKGDEVLEINGKPAKEYKLEDIRELSKSEDGTEIQMKIKHKEELKSIKFQLKELI